MLNTLPKELLTQVAYGNCVVMMGNSADAQNRQRSFADELAELCDYPLDKPDCSLPAVARIYQATMGGPQHGRQALVARLREWLEQDGHASTPLHRALVELPVKRIVDWSYDRRIEMVLREAEHRHTVVVQDHELPYVEPSGVWLVKPYGVADRPESLVLTEDDYLRFASLSSPSRPLLMNQLRVWTATQVLLWIGVDPQNPYWQHLHRALTEGISPHHRREYALARTERTVAEWNKHGVTAVMAPEPAEWLTDLTQAVANVPPRPVDIVPAPGDLLGRRPYKFLDFYTAEDADLFFGREQQAEDLVDRILAEPLVVLFGRSGVGKTSLLLAGIAPRLKQRDCWPIYARPGEDPIAALRTAAEADLSAADRAALGKITELGAFIEAAGARRGRVPVVILDQAEECFTALAPPMRARWVAALAQALQEAPAALHWVLSLREDFAAELHEWATQVPGLFDHTARLHPLRRQEARDAIVQPLAWVGAEIDAALVERVLDDMLGQREVDELTQEGVPPAPLQIVCDRLYSARDTGARITPATYEALGGARRILADYVDLALAQLPRARREMAVALLKAMVTGRETKLPLRPAEILNQVAGDVAEKRDVLMDLVDARLVRSLQVNDERRYELVHDVLVDKIRSWIDETEQAAQTARDLLRQGRSAWRDLRALPEREKVTYLHAQRENPYLNLSREDAELMVRAALREGLAPSYWVRRAVELGVAPWPLLAPLVESAREGERIHALWGLTGWDAPRSWERLRAGMADDAPRVRVAAHQALYHLGTPQALALLDASDDLRLVPAGEFTMGSDQQGDEKPMHQVTLESFFAEKYPVTNALYARFIEAGGYENEQWWTRAGWEWARRMGRTQPAFWDDEKWNRPEYPVVGVTWYEAWAYAHWAGRRLLTEAEWEKAARGADGRAYPWGDEFDGEKCNVGTGKMFGQSGGTTPVGQYSPAGDSPYGCVDMAGNVWEWTSSLYQPYPYRADDGRESVEVQGDRVERGGSWFNALPYARCAVRCHLPPDYVGLDLGCRCGVGCASSHSLSLAGD